MINNFFLVSYLLLFLEFILMLFLNLFFNIQCVNLNDNLYLWPSTGKPV